MDHTNYADEGDIPFQVGRFARDEQRPDTNAGGTEVETENIRSGNARVGVQTDEIHGDLNIHPQGRR